MCDELLQRSGQDHDEKCFADPSFITKKNFLQFIEEHSRYEQAIPLHAPSSIVYPNANLYYAFSENTHPITRIATVSKYFENEKLLPHSVSSEESSAIQEFYSRDEAVNHYLKTDPPNFAIFGKPGLNNIDVASAIADVWKCILISPALLIRQEIDAGTEKGQYIEKNLRLGKCVEPEVIMDLIRCRIKMRDVGHRGYVVEGLPLIPNDISFDYSSYSTYTLHTNHDDLKFCKKGLIETYETCKYDATLCSDRNLSDNLNCKVQTDYEKEIPRQVDEIFTTWPKKPLIIIYAVCPKQDIVNRCARRRMETVTGNSVDVNALAMHPLDNKLQHDESDISFDFFQVTNESSFTSNDRRIYLLRRIPDMKQNVELQCDLYERLALPVIDKWILAHNPQHVIRVDGRNSIRRILQILNIRLRTLSLQLSILPKRMFKQNDAHFLDMDNKLAKISAEEAFEVLRRKGTVSPRFPWKLSAWKFYCPVELAQGRTIKGLAEYSVLFLNKIFFLSSQQAEDLFVENPRTFLSSPNPRPSCKIAVFGPKFAGKSELSLQLAEIFGGTVINVDQIVKKLIKQRIDKEVNIFHGTENDKNLLHDYAPQEDTQIQKLYEKNSDVQILLNNAKRVYDESYLPVDEKADIIVQTIKTIPKDKLEGELQRDGGYVVDGMYVDINVWRKIIDDTNIVFEDIIVLFEDKPYTYLLNKFRSFSHLDDSIYGVEYETDYEEYKISGKDTEWEYLEHLKQFESEWAKFEEQISEFEGNVIKCNLADIKDITEYIINHFKRRFNAAITTTSVEEQDEEREILEEATFTEDKRDLTNEEFTEDKKKYPIYTIDLETAEQLLNCGYYFLSSFGRWCPVQMYSKKVPIQMFLPMETRGQIFPVIYRLYIYFIASEEALFMFLSDPSRYLARDFYLPLLPLHISIIGPPKCGKTTLARRFAQTYDMKRITRGKALRHMLKYYDWTESALRIEGQLRAGQSVPVESITRAVEIFSMGPRAITQGYILDDCPSNRKEAEQLILLGIQPMIVLDLKADLHFCLECLSWDNNDTKRPSNFSANFLSQRYANWQVHQASFRNWLKKFSQNVIELDATRSKWNIWTRANHAVCSRFTDILLYFRDVNFDKVRSLRYMCVSPYEFRSRQSRYESYCPVCLLRENILKSSGQQVNSQGTVQFREHFYWICPRHMDAFVKEPLQHIPPVNTTSLPDERPQILKEIVDVEHTCWARLLHIGGLCVVTYVDGLPNRKLTQGRPDLAVLLKNKVYLFCSEKCREKFLAQHSKYSEVDIMFPRELPPIELRSLPDIGFLEQTVAKTVVEAVNLVATHRPKIFNLSAAVSAAIYIGVYLKTHNMTQKLNEVNIYKVASERIAERDSIVKIVTDTMKKKLNPYVSLPKYS